MQLVGLARVRLKRGQCQTCGAPLAVKEVLLASHPADAAALKNTIWQDIRQLEPAAVCSVQGPINTPEVAKVDGAIINQHRSDPL